MVPSVPVIPAPAVTGPLTGGQICAQLPLQLDLVAVSGANQYKVKPPAFVSTVAPLIVAVFNAVPDDAWPAGVLAALLELPEELPHAAVISVTAAIRPATRYLFRIGGLPSAAEKSYTWDYESCGCLVHGTAPNRRRRTADRTLSVPIDAEERVSSTIRPARRTNIRYSSRRVTSPRCCRSLPRPHGFCGSPGERFPRVTRPMPIAGQWN